MADAMVVIDFKGQPGPAGEIPWTLVSGATDLAIGQRYGVDTTAGAVTLTLPPLADVQPGWSLPIADIGGHADTHNIVVAPGAGGDQINGATGNYAFAVARGLLRLIVNAAATSWETVS
jgi:ribosomal protein L2